MASQSKTDTSKDRIYQELRRSIILGHIQPGEKLNLENLSERYQTSVTPVREALQMLAQEELITSRPHTGYFVTRITLKELSDLLELREILELAAVERAAGEITPEQIAELRDVHAEGITEEDSSYARAVIENRQFHYLIALYSGNQELAEVLGSVHDRLARFFVFVHSPSGVEKRHQRLISALEKHDRDLARQTMLDEINETRRITLEKVIEKDGTTWYLGSQNHQKSGNDHPRKT